MHAITQVEGLAPWPVQLGPEFIHGDAHNVLKDFVDKQGWTCREYQFPDMYFFGKDKRLAGPCKSTLFGYTRAP